MTHRDRVSTGADRTGPDAVLARLAGAVAHLEDTPEAGSDVLVAAIDDLERALRLGGFGLRPVHAARARLARDRGDDATAELELASWLAAPRDLHSGCPVCELREQALLVQRTDPQRALALVAPVIAGEQGCSEEPRRCLSLDAELRLDRGDVDEAVTSLRRAWQPAQDDPDAAEAVGACLRVFLRLGNADRAVDLLVPRLGWLDELKTPRDRMWFAATAAHVLDRADAVGLAPRTVDGRPVRDVADELGRLAGGIASAFDARYGSTVTSTTLAAAHDPSRVPTEPTLPPTRLPAPRPGEADPERVDPRAGVLERAEVVREGLRSLDVELRQLCLAWLRDRGRILPVSTPQEWAAASFLDRVSAQQAGDLREQRAVLDLALAEAERAGDHAGVTRAEGELALLDVAAAGDPGAAAAARSRARSRAEQLEAGGDDVEAAGLWRRIAWFGGSEDPAADVSRAAAAYGRAGYEERRLMCGIEQAMADAPTDPARAAAALEALEPEVAPHALLASMALDGRARLARSTGDLDAASLLLQRALAVRGAPRRTRLTVLTELCDVRVDQEAWAELEGPAADLVAAATRDLDPVLLALGQRFLGLAYVETGRPVEAAELLEAALPVLREHEPAVVGPVGWALGNALVALRQWVRAGMAFVAAAADFEAQERGREAAHALWAAGNAAWEAGAVDEAARHFDGAADRARAAAAVGLYVEVLRSRAALRADSGDLAGGLAALDSAVAAGERLAAETGAGEDEFDGEVLEPQVLRQGAHLLALQGEVDAAVERLGRAEALVGHELELVLHAEGAIMLADDDRLEAAEPRLRASLSELHAAGLVPTRVEAAGALARALDRAGRGDEAREVWDRYGPDA